MRSLPDPDPILEQMGKGITALPGLLSDSHMESVWSVRCSVTSGAEWFISPGADGWRETEAAEAFSSELAALDIPRIIEDDDRRGGVWVRAAGNYLAGEGRALVYWQYRGETAPVV
jgi:hypothetical protein